MYDASCPDFRTDAAPGVSLENSMTPLKPQKRRVSTGENPAFMAKAVITLARATITDWVATLFRFEILKNRSYLLSQLPEEPEVCQKYWIHSDRRSFRQPGTC